MNHQEGLDLALATCDHAGIQPGTLEVVYPYRTTRRCREFGAVTAAYQQRDCNGRQAFLRGH